MGKTIIFAVILLASGVLAARMADPGGHAPTTPMADRGAQAPAMRSAIAAQSVPVPRSSNNSRTVTLSPGNGGHFWTDARVDGRRLEFVVDTGASQIALRASDAAQLGIHPTPRDFSVKVMTANGVSRAAPVQLRMVEIGNVVVRDVPALVQADDGMGVSLLGMSFLSRVRFTHDRGKLILEQ